MPHTEWYSRWLDRNPIRRLTANVHVVDPSIDPYSNQIEVIVSDISARIMQLTDDRPTKNRYVELISSAGLYANILIAYEKDKEIVIVDKDYKCATKVDSGTYEANIRLHADSKTITRTENFIVGRQNGRLYVKWERGNVKA
jgi:hypothetical protein